MKQIIRLTESDLHRLVKESVKKIINEYGVVGKIPNFDRNKSYTRMDGEYMDNQKVIAMAKKELISIISKPFEIDAHGGKNDYGYFYAETPDGWSFEADDIPLDVIIDSYSYYSPATWWDPEEYGDTEGYVDNIEMPKYIYFCPPGGKYNEWQKIQFDETIKDLFVKNAEASEDSIRDALGDKEEYERDMEAGAYDDYINREIDRRRGED